MVNGPLSFDRLFQLRLVVARHGEMDVLRWWNTQGILGPRGAFVFKRGFPRTHNFAQARAVFAVARARCNEVFSPPGCMTLWNLPAEIEDQFEEHWQDWLDHRDAWSPFFQKLAELKSNDLLEALVQFELVSPAQASETRKLRRSAESRAVPLPAMHLPNDEVFAMLAAGFSRGDIGNLAVPYARLEGPVR